MVAVGRSHGLCLLPGGAKGVQAPTQQWQRLQPDASPRRCLTGADWGTVAFTSVFGGVFEHWGKASAFHSAQLASTVNLVLVFPCTVCIVVFINQERKSHLSLPRSSLTFEL